MLNPVHKTLFNADIKRAKKRGWDIEKLKTIIGLLLREQPLPPKNRNHKLKGEYAGCWECHIQPDWLLIYIKSTQN